MLKKLSFKNFYSFAEETVVDFSLGKKPLASGYDITLANGDRYNKAVAVIGPNGSGKTQLLKPFAFLSWFITESFLDTAPDDTIPFDGHKLYESDHSHFSLEFCLQQQEYRYDLTATPKGVVSEALFLKTSSQYSYVFKRERTAEGFSFKQKGMPFPKAQAEQLRANTSLLSAAYSYDIKEAKPLIDFFKQFETNVVNIGRRPFHRSRVMQVAEKFEQAPQLKQLMSDAMSQFDLGLTAVSIEQITVVDEQGKDNKVFMPFGEHQTERGKDFRLPFFEESSGTQSAFVLLEPILSTLLHGGIAVIDEIDNDLHPHLVPLLLDWFRFEHTNPRQAQIIFSCHTPEVLNLLQKHQIYLVEKYNQCSEAWRTDDIEGLRADDNLYAKYMAGALGAVPEL